MSQKRQQEDGKARSDGNCPDDKRRRIPTLKNVVLEVMKMQPVQHLLEPILEPLIRKVVKEEVDIALKKYVNSMRRSYEKDVPHSETRSLQLQFMSSLSLPVFTGARIEGEECSAVKMALVDARSGQIIDSGPESLAKVEIVVLEGDFDSDETENWTVEEFKNNIVREREGKKPLLTGEAILNLKDGVCSLVEIAFTDNSSWTRSRRFRIGARVIDNFDGIRIREAKTESFIVRDHRGELYKKHHPPSLLDEVWRLEKIGKDGAFHKRLSRENIHTVKDFLTLLHIDPSRLRHILGTGMSAKMWEVTVEHARTCVIDKRVYLYCPPTSQLKTGVVFNLVGQVMGLLSDCQFVPIEKLSETEMVDAHNLAISAFQHWEEVVSFDEEAYLIAGSSNVSSDPCNSSSPKTEGLNACKFLSCERISGFDYAAANASSPDIISSIYSTGDVSGLDDYTLHGIENMGLRYNQTLSFPNQVANSMICDARSMSQDFFDEDHLQFFDSDCPLPSHSTNFDSQADLQCAVNEFLLKPSAVAIANAQKRWKKLFSVLKWFWVRKIVVMRRTRQREIQRWLPIKTSKARKSILAHTPNNRNREADMEDQKGHVLVLTYPAQGHINPLLQFAKRLASKGLRATLATTHYTFGSIKAERVHVEPISDGFDEGGHKQAPSTQAYIESFRRVGSRTLSELISKFSETEYPVNCIVYDSLLPWALDVAKTFGIYAAVLLTNSAAVCSLYWYIHQGRLTFPLCPDAMPIVLPGLPLLEFSDLPSFLADSDSQSVYLALIMEKFARLGENDWVFCNSFEELEAELVKALFGIWPLAMVGPLVPSAYVDRQIDGDTSYGGSLWNPTGGDRCSRWLDERPLGSVIYVSFGSMGNISSDQVEEIAFGLKATGKYFIWVLKDFERKLKSPIQFLDSIQDRGLVVEWCDQLEVLAHRAVGCFVTHCGWNSALEGLSLGTPVVGVPLWSDQPTNAKFLEEKWRVGLRAGKGERGMVTREEVEMRVREVVEGERSEEFRKNALNWKERAKIAVSRGGSSDKNLGEFVAKIREGGGKTPLETMI